MKGTVFEDRNMNASREMPKYECHKKVWALKIAGIVGDQHGGVYFQPAEEGYDNLATHPKSDTAAKDAERYRLLRRGQHWSVVDGIGDTLRADALDAAIDAVTEDTSNAEVTGFRRNRSNDE
jgi:hypothetical protein